MELIKPDGTKIEAKHEPVEPEKAEKDNNGQEPGAGVQEVVKGEAKPGAESQAKPEELPEPPLKFDFSRVGWMKIEVNLDMLSYHQSLVDQFGGFMDRMKHQGYTIIGRIAEQRGAVKNALMKEQNKNGFRNFLDKIRRK